MFYHPEHAHIGNPYEECVEDERPFFLHFEKAEHAVQKSVEECFQFAGKGWFGFSDDVGGQKQTDDSHQQNTNGAYDIHPFFFQKSKDNIRLQYQGDHHDEQEHQQIDDPFGDDGAKSFFKRHSFIGGQCCGP